MWIEEIRLVRERDPKPADAQVLEEEIARFNIAATGRPDWAPVAIFLRDRAGKIRGGLNGDIWAGWLHVRFLWLEADLRRHGFGSRLLREAETIAREHGCRAVHLETFSFQAPDFYRKHGYEMFGRLDDYPEGHAHYYFRKTLDGGTKR